MADTVLLTYNSGAKGVLCCVAVALDEEREGPTDRPDPDDLDDPGDPDDLDDPDDPDDLDVIQVESGMRSG